MNPVTPPVSPPNPTGVSATPAACGVAQIRNAIAVCQRFLLRRKRRLVHLAQDASGTATIEFALVFPIVLFVSLALAQTTLLMAGYIFVHYSAAAAVRQAVVAIPADRLAEGEPRNVMRISDHSVKHQTIRRAAALSLVPVAGRLGENATPTQGYVAGLRAHYTAYGQTPPRWIDNLAADRLRYVDANTFIVMMVTQVSGSGELRQFPLMQGDGYQFGPREAVTVRVEHRLNLTVPYVAALFANGKHEADTGQGWYVRIGAQATLQNQGLSDTLPPTPRWPRIDPDDA